MHDSAQIKARSNVWQRVHESQIISAIMERAEDYVGKGSLMQNRDIREVVEEFSYELSKMRGRCLDIGSGPGVITKETLLPILPHDAELVGEQMKI